MKELIFLLLALVLLSGIGWIAMILLKAAAELREQMDFWSTGDPSNTEW